MLLCYFEIWERGSSSRDNGYYASFLNITGITVSLSCKTVLTMQFSPVNKIVHTRVSAPLGRNE